MSSPAFGQHPAPSHVLAHLSDTHLVADGKLLNGFVDSTARLTEALGRLESAAPDVEVIVVSGDLTDLGEVSAYETLRTLVTATADRIGASVVWAAGNHDDRRAMWRGLFDQDSDARFDSVTDVRGLRIVTLDSSLPDYHHGAFEPGQAEWLADVLADPAPHGTLLVMHHPPLPYRVQLMRILEFRDEARLAAVLHGSDVRAILSGHLHINGSGTFAGIPVILASATSQADDLGSGPLTFRTIDADQSVNVVEVFPHTVTHSVVPARSHDPGPGQSTELYEQLRSATDDERREAFSRKR